MQTMATVVLTAAAWGVWLHACSIAATAVAEQLQAVLEWNCWHLQGRLSAWFARHLLINVTQQECDCLHSAQLVLSLHVQ
jgi:uncharacterized RmlC-like cupin family protein